MKLSIPKSSARAGSKHRAVRLAVGLTGAASLVDMSQYLLQIRKCFEVELRVVLTPTAERMVSSGVWQSLATSGILTDRDWVSAEHEEIAAWCDIFLVMPCTASTIASMSVGDARTLVSAAALCARRTIVVPSMNELMYLKPAVQRNLRMLESDGIDVVKMERKDVYIFGTRSFSVGLGMASVEAVLDAVQTKIHFHNEALRGEDSV